MISSPFDDLIISFSKFDNCGVNIEKKAFADILEFIRDFRVLYLLMQNRLFRSIIPERVPPAIQITFGDFCIETRVKFYAFISHINLLTRFIQSNLKGAVAAPPLANRIYFYRNKVVEHWDDYVTHFNDGTMAASGKIPIPTLSWSFSPPETQEQRRGQLVDSFAKQGIKIDVPKDIFFEDLALLVYPKMEEIDPELKDRGKLEEISECLWNYNFPLPFYDCEKYTSDLVEYFKSFLKCPAAV